MKRLILLLAALSAFAGGCPVQRYQTQPLGSVDYLKAFGVGKAVFARHFPIASADSSSGKIIGRPKPVDAAADRLLASSPARKLAEMRLRTVGGEVIAEVRVDIQRQDAAAFRGMRPVTVDDELPHQTPALGDAAVSLQQKHTWRTTGRDRALERAILKELLERLAE